MGALNDLHIDGSDMCVDWNDQLSTHRHLWIHGSIVQYYVSKYSAQTGVCLPPPHWSLSAIVRVCILAWVGNVICCVFFEGRRREKRSFRKVDPWSYFSYGSKDLLLLSNYSEQNRPPYEQMCPIMLPPTLSSHALKKVPTLEQLRCKKSAFRGILRRSKYFISSKN